MLSESDIKKRLPVWEALSGLFLDTEVDEITHKSIARIIMKSGFKQDEVHNILWKEVFPAVGDNLRCVAGEWGGFNSEWLKERILSITSVTREQPTLSSYGIISVATVIDITKEEWSKVCSFLPKDFSEPLLLANSEILTNRRWWQFW